jgi:hypothetical protein
VGPHEIRPSRLPVTSAETSQRPVSRHRSPRAELCSLHGMASFLKLTMAPFAICLSCCSTDPSEPCRRRIQRWAIVNNNENYNGRVIRVQRQGRAPRSAANNNEYQCEEQGQASWAEHPLLARGRESGSRGDVAHDKARRGLPPGHTTQVSISRIG